MLYEIIIIVLIIFVSIWLSWWFKKNLNNTDDLIDEESENNLNNLKNITNHINDTNELLKTYKKVIEEKTTELNFYKQGADVSKHKSLYLNLIDILNFTKSFEISKQDNEKTKNYLLAVQDKVEILLKSSGVEEYYPIIGKNVMMEKGCTASPNTKKTDDQSKENCINKILKPGYCIVLNENDTIHLKDALVEIFELNKNV